MPPELFPACPLHDEWQRALFADRLRRDELLSLPPLPAGAPLRINIHRNHAFEPVAAHLRVFLAYAGWYPHFVSSSYDDSFLFQDHAPADLEIVWIDYNRYSASGEELLRWFEERLLALRKLSGAPILVPDDAAATDSALNRGLRALAGRVGGVRVWPQSELSASLSGEYFDDRLAMLSGTRLSGTACLHAARLLGCVWIPPCLAPRIKAILTDLDNTLYDGVLGEDGPAALVLKPEHRRLQATLKKLREDGVFLGIVSRNEPSDVQRMFQERPDFPLRFADFSECSIGWLPKSEGIRSVAARLRIGADSVLFLDDNPGELAEAAAGIPGLHTIYAADPGESLRALRWYPRLNGYEKTAEGALRIGDLAAARIRDAEMAQRGDARAYLRGLNIEMEFALNPGGDAQRLHELSIKTNQFNTGLRRFSDIEVRRRLTEAGNAVVGIRMRDRLSDSGMIAALFARLEGGAIVIDEIAISCRALGRQMEDIMIAEAIRGAADALAGAEGRTLPVQVLFQDGPRNQPARAWLARYGAPEPDSGGRVSLPQAALPTRESASALLSIQWRKYGQAAA